MPHDRAAELREIEAFLARRGPTRCRAAFADAVPGALSLREEQDRILAFRAEPPMISARRAKQLMWKRRR
jgi:hypothetical protein